MICIYIYFHSLYTLSNILITVDGMKYLQLYNDASNTYFLYLRPVCFFKFSQRFVIDNILYEMIRCHIPLVCMSMEGVEQLQNLPYSGGTVTNDQTLPDEAVNAIRRGVEAVSQIQRNNEDESRGVMWLAVIDLGYVENTRKDDESGCYDCCESVCFTCGMSYFCSRILL
jgi:hypothetical protein